MDTVVILNNPQYKHDKYQKYWEMNLELLENCAKVITGDEIDELMKDPFKIVNSLSFIVLDDYGSKKARNWMVIINKLLTCPARSPGLHRSIIIADNHTLNKMYTRDKRIVIKKEW